MDICTGEEKKGAAWPRVRLGAKTESRARWPSGLVGLRYTVFESPTAEFASDFGNSVYICQCLSEETQSRGSLVSGVYGYAGGSKRSHQSALESVTVVDSNS